MMAYEWAKPGAKVVCVIDTDIRGLLEEGKVYEIRDVISLKHQKYLNKREAESVVLKLTGFMDKYEYEDGRIVGFNIKRFRPLITKGLPDTLTILLEKLNRLIVPDGFDNLRIKTKEKVKAR